MGLWDWLTFPPRKFVDQPFWGDWGHPTKQETSAKDIGAANGPKTGVHLPIVW